ncbi:MAG: NAD(P)/FAD-dependent oxidoreductase [Verrucomicrobiales bacterium]|nr:NAD(P)/FAD-dependent oxidoreductase [Verrucomicrobiales bacterium]
MSNDHGSSSLLSFDAAVIGGGSAGYAAARTLAAAGKRVAVLEGGREVGGLCILRGCMPTKAMLYAAEIAHLARQSATWGVTVPEVGIAFPELMRRKDAMITDFAGYRAGQLQDGRFTFLRHQARFVGPKTLQLDDGRQLNADHVIIATGSQTTPPSLPGLAETGYLTSDQAVHLAAAPRSLILLGGGAVACEFAQFFARIGTRVTQIQRGAHLLRGSDPDAAAVVERVFRREGIELHTDTRLTGAGRDATGKWVEFESKAEARVVRVHAEEIMLALGRLPNTGSLDLNAAGIRTDSGRIVTDARMETSVPGVYAAGDCTGPHEIVHIAIQQGESAAHHILHPEQPRPLDYRLLLSVVFTDPQWAQVGLTESEARRQGRPVRVASYPFADHGRSMIMDAMDGFVKLLADPITGEILGGTCVGPHAGELIHEVVVAMANRMTAAALAAVPHYHPTLAEIWTYPAEELASPPS